MGRQKYFLELILEEFSRAKNLKLLSLFIFLFKKNKKYFCDELKGYGNAVFKCVDDNRNDFLLIKYCNIKGRNKKRRWVYALYDYIPSFNSFFEVNRNIENMKLQIYEYYDFDEEHRNESILKNRLKNR